MIHNGAGEVDCLNTIVDAPVSGSVPAVGYDPDVRYVRVRPGGTMARLSRFSVRFKARIN